MGLSAARRSSLTALLLGLGLYMRKALNPDTVMEFDVEEGFNLNGQALDERLKQNWAIYGRVALIDDRPESAVSYAGIPLEQTGDDPSNLAVGMYYHF